MANGGTRSQDCIQDPSLLDAWSCLPPIGVGVTILGQGSNATLAFDPYPLEPTFWYGAQPPDLNRRPLQLAPSMDRDSDELGTSLFAWTNYDKLTICEMILVSYTSSLTNFAVHEEDLQPSGPSKRDHDGERGMPAHKPWFCWFNQTVLEVFIYVGKPLDSATVTSTDTLASSATASSMLTSSLLQSSSPTPVTSSATIPIHVPTFIPAAASSFYAAAASASASYHPWFSAYSDDSMVKRNWYDDIQRNEYADYPLLIKIEEKRKPSGNIQPYCQQMQILENMKFVPKEAVDPIPVPEVASAEAPASRRFRRRGSDDGGTTCACQWISGQP
jgi:hypothetical protein